MTKAIRLDSIEISQAAQPSEDGPSHMRAFTPDRPQVSVFDLGVTRGDGIFEVITVVDGHLQALRPHLQRLRNSGAMIDLPPFDMDLIEHATRKVAAEEYAETSDREILVKIVVTRGIEGAQPPSLTSWVLAYPNEDYERQRKEGIDVVTLDRGYPHDIAARAPWLLTGAKTLSYAVNRAAIREADRREADMALFVSSDGYVLEGPVSSLVVRFGNRMWTPATGQGVLSGTTQGSAFDYLAGCGFATGEALLRVRDLEKADAMWLMSSGQLAAPVRSLDGRAVAVDLKLSNGINEALLARTE